MCERTTRNHKKKKKEIDVREKRNRLVSAKRRESQFQSHCYKRVLKETVLVQSSDVVRTSRPAPHTVSTQPFRKSWTIIQRVSTWTSCNKKSCKVLSSIWRRHSTANVRTLLSAYFASSSYTSNITVHSRCSQLRNYNSKQIKNWNLQSVDRI